MAGHKTFKGPVFAMPLSPQVTDSSALRKRDHNEYIYSHCRLESLCSKQDQYFLKWLHMYSFQVHAGHVQL